LVVLGCGGAGEGICVYWRWGRTALALGPGTALAVSAGAGTVLAVSAEAMVGDGAVGGSGNRRKRQLAQAGTVLAVSAGATVGV